MDRDLDHSPQQDSREMRENAATKRPASSTRLEPPHTPEDRSTGGEKAREFRGREPVERGRPCRISPAEHETLAEIGRFRAIALKDLTRYQYGGNDTQLKQDLRALRAQGLVQRRTVWTGGHRDRLTVVVLTRRGKEAIHPNAGAAGQRFYSGLVKPAEIHHDSAIYRMYQLEAERIRKAGGRVGRVVLDFELKQKVFAALAKAKAQQPFEQAASQSEIARQNGLKVVQGKIPLPDLRIEYEAADGERSHVDLELATHHYRGSQVRAKAEAGFKIYAAAGSASHLSSALEDPKIMTEILSL